MAHDLFTNVSSLSFTLTDTAAWLPITQSRFLDINSIASPDGRNTAVSYVLSGSDDPYVWQVYAPADGNIEGKTFKFRAFLATDLSSHDILQIFINAQGGGENNVLQINDTDTSSSFKLFEKEATFSNSAASLNSRIDGYQTCSSGDTFRVWFPHLIIDDQIVSLEPDYDYTELDTKIEDRHRVRSSVEYVYKWSEYKRRKFGISFVSSDIKSKVNSWWGSNEDLLFMSGSEGIDVNSMRLMNKNLPIGKFIKPYSDLFKGVIELETY